MNQNRASARPRSRPAGGGGGRRPRRQGSASAGTSSATMVQVASSWRATRASERRGAGSSGPRTGAASPECHGAGRGLPRPGGRRRHRCVAARSRAPQTGAGADPVAGASGIAEPRKHRHPVPLQPLVEAVAGRRGRRTAPRLDHDGRGRCLLQQHEPPLRLVAQDAGGAPGQADAGSARRRGLQPVLGQPAQVLAQEPVVLDAADGDDGVRGRHGQAGSAARRGRRAAPPSGPRPARARPVWRCLSCSAPSRSSSEPLRRKATSTEVRGLYRTRVMWTGSPTSSDRRSSSSTWARHGRAPSRAARARSASCVRSALTSGLRCRSCGRRARPFPCHWLPARPAARHRPAPAAVTAHLPASC